MSFLLSNLFTEKYRDIPWVKLALFFSFSMFTVSSGYLRRLTIHARNKSIKASAHSDEGIPLMYSSISAIPGTMRREDQPCLNPIDQHSVVLVVGGTRGIGLEFVKQLLAKKATGMSDR